MHDFIYHLNTVNIIHHSNKGEKSYDLSIRGRKSIFQIQHIYNLKKNLNKLDLSQLPQYKEEYLQ